MPIPTSPAPRPDPTPEEAAEPGFWRGIYRTEPTPGWDKGGSPPPIARLLREGAVPRGRVAVPGCGFGWDVILLAREGFDPWGFDFAPEGIEGARRNLDAAGARATLEVRDVLTMGEAYPSFFDAVCEHTCLAAIPPHHREAYARAVAAALRPDGLYFGLFYCHGRPGGPPYDAPEATIRNLFHPAFAVERWETPADSFESRRGKERLFVFRKTTGS